MNALFDTKTVTAIVALCALCLATAAFAGPANPTLRSAVSVPGDHVTLGDLFTDAGDAADVIVANSPEPGFRQALSVSKVSQVARRNGLRWYNRQGLTRVVVTRSAIQVPADIIRDAVIEAVVDQSTNMASPGDYDLSFTARMPALYVAEGDSLSVAIDRLNYEPRTGRFEATVRTPADDPSARSSKVRGRAVRMVEIPVAGRPLKRGDVIRATDLGWLRVPVKRLPAMAARDAADLVGMAASRHIQADRPLRLSDVQAPIVVKKGEQVMIAYDVPGMSLTARGRALAAGAVGDVIAVTNTRSNRTMEGTVAAAGLVRIMSGFAAGSTDQVATR